MYISIIIEYVHHQLLMNMYRLIINEYVHPQLLMNMYIINH